MIQNWLLKMKRLIEKWVISCYITASQKNIWKVFEWITNRAVCLYMTVTATVVYRSSEYHESVAGVLSVVLRVPLEMHTLQIGDDVMYILILKKRQTKENNTVMNKEEEYDRNNKNRASKNKIGKKITVRRLGLKIGKKLNIYHMMSHIWATPFLWASLWKSFKKLYKFG